MANCSLLDKRTGLFLVSCIICLSCLCPVPVSCNLDDFAEGADVAKTMLGPNLSEGDRTSCPAEGCPDEDRSSDGPHETPPTKDTEGESEKRSEVAKRPDDPGLWGTLFNTASNGLATVSRTLYDRMSDMSARFADTVRKIMSEELYDLLAASARKVGQAMFTPGATLYYLGETAASISLALLCLLLFYIFLRFFSLLSIAAFISATFLLHQVVGAIVIFEWLFWAGSYVLEIAYFFVWHYYLTSIAIVVAFGFVVARWMTRKSDRQLLREVWISTIEKGGRTKELHDTVVALRREIKALKDNQEKMMNTLEEIRRAVVNKDNPA